MHIITSGASPFNFLKSLGTGYGHHTQINHHNITSPLIPITFCIGCGGSLGIIPKTTTYGKGHYEVMMV